MSTMNDTTHQGDGWTVSLDIDTGDTTGVVDDAIAALPRKLEGCAPAVAGGAGYARWGITLSIDADSDIEDAAQAAWEARVIVREAAEAAGLPWGEVVDLHVQTYAEQDRELSEPNFPELLGVAELADYLEVSKARASELAKKPPAGFPAPIVVLRSGPVWTKPSLSSFVEHWDRRPGRRPAVEDSNVVDVMAAMDARDAAAEDDQHDRAAG